MEDKLSTIIPRYSEELNEAVDNIISLLTEAYETSCPEVKSIQRKGGKLWSYEIEQLRKTARKAWNYAYKSSQKMFRKAVKMKARDLWKNFCAEMEQIPDYAKIHKILVKDLKLLPFSLLKPDGSYTSCGKETATHLLETHFPGCSDTKAEARIPNSSTQSEEDWALASRIVTVDRLKWAIGKFKAFKSADDDGIFPALLKESGEILLEPLCKVLRSSLVLCRIPQAWEKVKVTFIPKPGRPSHCVAKDCRPISLTSFILKTLERLIDFCIRDEVKYPLHVNQHAYQAGKSTD